MEIDIHNFFGIDLTKEPNESWKGFGNNKTSTCIRKKGSRSIFQMCMADVKLHNIAIIFSDKVEKEYNELIKMFNRTEENGQIKLSIVKEGFEFLTYEGLTQFHMLVIIKR